MSDHRVIFQGEGERRAPARRGSGFAAVERLVKRGAIIIRFLQALCGPKLVCAGVTIRGEREFITVTVQALGLLKARAPEAYRLVQKYIGEIVSITPSAVFPRLLWLGPTYVFIGPAYSAGPAAEYAAAIAHEAYHCDLYANAPKGKRGKPLDPDSYSGEGAEALCLQYQCAVLRKLGLEEERIKQYEGRLESKWWEVPFEERNW